MQIRGGRHTARVIGLASLSNSCSGRSATAANASQKVATCKIADITRERPNSWTPNLPQSLPLPLPRPSEEKAAACSTA